MLARLTERIDADTKPETETNPWKGVRRQRGWTSQETMNGKKQKLELTWIGNENRPRLEPRILLEDPEKSYQAAHRVTEHGFFDIAENMSITALAAPFVMV